MTGFWKARLQRLRKNYNCMHHGGRAALPEPRMACGIAVGFHRPWGVAFFRATKKQTCALLPLWVYSLKPLRAKAGNSDKARAVAEAPRGGRCWLHA